MPPQPTTASECVNIVIPFYSIPASQTRQDLQKGPRRGDLNGGKTGKKKSILAFFVEQRMGRNEAELVVQGSILLDHINPDQLLA